MDLRSRTLWEESSPVWTKQQQNNRSTGLCHHHNVNESRKIPESITLKNFRIADLNKKYVQLSINVPSNCIAFISLGKPPPLNHTPFLCGIRGAVRDCFCSFPKTTVQHSHHFRLWLASYAEARMEPGFELLTFSFVTKCLKKKRPKFAFQRLPGNTVWKCAIIISPLHLQVWQFRATNTFEWWVNMSYERVLHWNSYVQDRWGTQRFWRNVRKCMRGGIKSIACSETLHGWINEKRKKHIFCASHSYSKELGW